MWARDPAGASRSLHENTTCGDSEGNITLKVKLLSKFCPSDNPFKMERSAPQRRMRGKYAESSRITFAPGHHLTSALLQYAAGATAVTKLLPTRDT